MTTSLNCVRDAGIVIDQQAWENGDLQAEVEKLEKAGADPSIVANAKARGIELAW